jgi:hypothetical protein
LTRYAIVHDEAAGWVLLEVVEQIRELGRFTCKQDAERERNWRKSEQEKLP